MIETQATIKSPAGLHARPAKELVNLAKKYTSSVKLEHNGIACDARSMLQIMKMAVGQGGQVKIMIEGDDEKAASEEITTFLDSFTD